MPNTGVTTLLTIRTSCKQQSDEVGMSRLTDGEWDALIQSSYRELYGMIVEAFGNDYFVASPTSFYTFTTNGTSDHFALPDGSVTYLNPDATTAPAFFKLLGVDLRLTSSSQYISLRPFSMAERNRYSLFNNGIPMSGQTVRLIYVPRVTVPTVDADLLDGVNGWEDYIVCKSCLIALAKEESDVSVFMSRLAALEKRLASEIENRDAGSPPKIVDTRGRALSMQYRLNGNYLWLIGGVTPGWAPYGDWGGEGLGWW